MCNFVPILRLIKFVPILVFYKSMFNTEIHQFAKTAGMFLNYLLELNLT